MKRIKTAIVGASGYTGMELLRLLLVHPRVELVAATSRQEAGKALSAVFPRFRSAPGAELAFIEPDPEAIAATGAEVAFLALPHGVAAEIALALLARGLRVIDLSADFRLRDREVYAEFYGHTHPAPELLDEAIYGLPEIRAAEIAAARLVASPGCYPTSVLLPLLPLLRENLLEPDTIVANSMSGVSGAGKKGGPHSAVLRMHRKRPRLRAAETSALVRDRAGTLDRRWPKNCHFLPAASHSGDFRDRDDDDCKAPRRRLAGRDRSCAGASVCERSVRAFAREGRLRGHKERHPHQLHRHRLDARPADRADDFDECRGQSRQRRGRPSGAEFQPDVRVR